MKNKYKKDSTQYYNKRYRRGYMEDWPNDKKRRIFELLKSLKLPETGKALDFGCGNGIFTSLIKEALPKWEVYGVDISDIAISNAKKRYSKCNFFVLSDEKYSDCKFDFIFTHHVLEHVENLDDIASLMQAFLSPSASMLHIFPCGNRGSFEYKICSAVKNGIDSKNNNRYFFEDKGHIRRADTKQMNNIFYKYGFRLETDYYSGQYYGAINWISKQPLKFINNLAKPSQAINLKSWIQLSYYRFILGLLHILRSEIPWVDQQLSNRAQVEWMKNKTQKHGSEMYLYYTR